MVFVSPTLVATNFSKRHSVIGHMSNFTILVYCPFQVSNIALLYTV